MKTTIKALLCIALLATYSSCIPIGGVFRKADFGLPDKIFFPKEGGERIYFAKKRIYHVTISGAYKDGYREYHDDNGFECIEHKWITIKYNGDILIVKVEPAPDDIQRSMRIKSVNAYDYQVTLVYQN